MRIEAVPFDAAGSEEEIVLESADESTLLGLAREGDRRAAEVLVERTYGPLYASLVRLCAGRTDRAADLTQETYRKAWEALPRFDGRSKMLTWLYRIAYNTFLNHVRQPNRSIPLEEASESAVADPGPSLDELLHDRDERARLRRAVLRLPEDLRFPVTAFFWADVPVREIARHEGVTTVAIRKRLKRAFQELASELGAHP